ncbi:hypothetical protein [Pasteurella testudinis]|uniref:hypothetical protein n=1 Tax=Pasteurella testudinis TaxID=761 RepID=UPI004058E5AB
MNNIVTPLIFIVVGLSMWIFWLYDNKNRLEHENDRRKEYIECLKNHRDLDSEQFKKRLELTKKRHNDYVGWLKNRMEFANKRCKERVELLENRLELANKRCKEQELKNQREASLKQETNLEQFEGLKVDRKVKENTENIVRFNEMLSDIRRDRIEVIDPPYIKKTHTQKQNMTHSEQSISKHYTNYPTYVKGTAIDTSTN